MGGAVHLELYRGKGVRGERDAHAVPEAFERLPGDPAGLLPDRGASASNGRAGPGDRERPTRVQDARDPVDEHRTLEPVPPRRQIHRGDLERHEGVEGRRHLQHHRVQSDRPAASPGALGRAGRLDPHLMGEPVGAAEQERTLHRDREPLVRGPDGDGVVLHVRATSPAATSASTRLARP